MNEKKESTQKRFNNLCDLVFNVSSALKDVSYSLHSPDKYNQSFSGGIYSLNEDWHIYILEGYLEFFDNKRFVSSLHSSDAFEIIGWANQNINQIRCC